MEVLLDRDLNGGKERTMRSRQGKGILGLVLRVSVCWINTMEASRA